MSMINRLVRAFETLSNVEVEGKDKGGMLGEDFAADIIEDGQNEYVVRNPIIPHPRKAGYYLETDFLVYTHGTIYCVEIKNFRGKVYYPARYHTVQVKKGWFIFSWTVPKTVFERYDYSKMVQEKMGAHGEGVTTREFPNPFMKTQQYNEDLARYLNHLDTRFAQIPIYPVVGFARKTDISTIHDLKQGIIYIDELPAFFEKHSTQSVNRAQAAWIQKGLSKLPTWDRILTTNNEWTYGTLIDPTLTFKEGNGKKQSIPYAGIRSITFARQESLSDYDEMTITYTNGKHQFFKSSGGEIRLNRFQGETQIHKLRNINQLTVGIANKV